MCNNFFCFVPAPIFGKENLPATKYLDCDIMLFWWLEKNKDLTTKQMVDELYSLICNRINDPITYKELMQYHIKNHISRGERGIFSGRKSAASLRGRRCFCVFTWRA